MSQSVSWLSCIILILFPWSLLQAPPVALPVHVRSRVRLGKVCDKMLDMAERESIAREFWDARDCDLDAGFSYKLRHRLTEQADLFNEDVQDFLHESFRQAVLSTGYVECMFASLRQWILRSQKPMTIDTLAAKHEQRSASQTPVSVGFEQS